MRELFEYILLREWKAYLTKKIEGGGTVINLKKEISNLTRRIQNIEQEAICQYFRRIKEMSDD